MKKFLFILVIVSFGFHNFVQSMKTNDKQNNSQNQLTASHKKRNRSYAFIKKVNEIQNQEEPIKVAIFDRIASNPFG